MLQDWKRVFKTPSARVLAQEELEEAQRTLLGAQAAHEYATAMVQYHAARIERLSRMLNTEAI